MAITPPNINPDDFEKDLRHSIQQVATNAARSQNKAPQLPFVSSLPVSNVGEVRDPYTLPEIKRENVYRSAPISQIPPAPVPLRKDPVPRFDPLETNIFDRMPFVTASPVEKPITDCAFHCCMNIYRGNGIILLDSDCGQSVSAPKFQPVKIQVDLECGSYCYYPSFPVIDLTHKNISRKVTAKNVYNCTQPALHEAGYPYVCCSSNPMEFRVIRPYPCIPCLPNVSIWTDCKEVVVDTSELLTMACGIKHVGEISAGCGVSIAMNSIAGTKSYRLTICANGGSGGTGSLEYFCPGFYPSPNEGTSIYGIASTCTIRGETFAPSGDSFALNLCTKGHTGVLKLPRTIEVACLGSGYEVIVSELLVLNVVGGLIKSSSVETVDPSNWNNHKPTLI